VLAVTTPVPRLERRGNTAPIDTVKKSKRDLQCDETIGATSVKKSPALFKKTPRLLKAWVGGGLAYSEIATLTPRTGSGGGRDV